MVAGRRGARGNRAKVKATGSASVVGGRAVEATVLVTECKSGTAEQVQIRTCL